MQQSARTGPLSPSKLTPFHSAIAGCTPDSAVSIKAAWPCANQLPSKIPSPPCAAPPATPGDKMVNNKGLFSSVIPSPSACTREDSLVNIEAGLEARLAAELQEQAAVLHTLSTIEPNTSKAASLTEQANKRGERVLALSQKLTRTRHTLKSLQSAQAQYTTSARKVQDAEARLQAAHAPEAIRRGSRRLSTADASRLRRELDEATSMMSVAFRRVEQIESITDALVRQLADAELELAEVQQLRTREATQHAEEVRQLDAERGSLRVRLQGVSQHANQLECEVEAAEEAQEETERAMREERALLVAALAQTQTELEQLHLDLADKDTQLQGEEATRVDVQEHLQRVLAEAAELQSQLAGLDAERQRQVAEKQTSLEGMTRAAAGAAKEAAIKQEALNKLACEVAALNEEQDQLQLELMDASHRCLELEAELEDARVQLEDARGDHSEAEAAIVQLCQQLEQAHFTASQLQLELDTKIAYAGEMEVGVAAMRARLQASEDAAAAATAKMTEKANTMCVQLAAAAESQTALMAERNDMHQQLQQHKAQGQELVRAVAAGRAALAEVKAAHADAQSVSVGRLEVMLRAHEDLQHQLADSESKQAKLAGQLDCRAAQCADQEAAIAALRGQVADAQLTAAESTAQAGEQATVLRQQLMAAAEMQTALVAERQQLEQRLGHEVQAVARLTAALEQCTDDASLQRFEFEAVVAGLQATEAQTAAELDVARTTKAEIAAAAEAAATVAASQLRAALQQADKLRQHKVSAEGRVAALRSQLKQQALDSRNQSDAAQTSLELASKDRAALQEQLQQQATVTADLQSKLCSCQDNVAELTAALDAKQTALAQLAHDHAILRGDLNATTDAARHAADGEAALRCQINEQAREAAEAEAALRSTNDELEKENGALQLNVQRLRVEVQQELEARQKAVAQHRAAAGKASALEFQLTHLTTELASLHDTVEHLGEVVRTADEQLQASQAAHVTETAALVADVVAVQVERDEAATARDAALVRVGGLERLLANAKSSLEAARQQGVEAAAQAEEEACQFRARVQELEQCLAEQQSLAADAEVRAGAMAAYLAATHSELEAVRREADAHGVANADLAEKGAAEAGRLRAERDEQAAGHQRASQRVASLEAALAESRLEVAQLSSLREEAARAEESAALATTLQARIVKLEASVSAAAADKAAAQAQVSAAQAELERVVQTTVSRQQLTTVEDELEAARAALVALQKERDLVLLALAQRENTAQERDAMMHAATMALAAQRDETAAARNVATAREADLAQALANASARVATLEADAAAMRAATKLTSLRLEKKGQEATKFAEAARKEAARAEVLERTAAELHAQVCAGEGARRLAAAHVMQQEEARRQVEVRLADAEAQAKALQRQLQGVRAGRTWTAVAACALAIGCSAVVGRSVSSSRTTTSSSK